MTNPERLKEIADKLRTKAEECLDAGDTNAAMGLLQEARMMDPYPPPPDHLSDQNPSVPELPASEPVLETPPAGAGG